MEYDPSFPIGMLSLIVFGTIILGVPILWVRWIILWDYRDHTKKERHLFGLLQAGLFLLVLLSTGFFIKI
jgi:hypothetical protein